MNIPHIWLSDYLHQASAGSIQIYHHILPYCLGLCGILRHQDISMVHAC